MASSSSFCTIISNNNNGNIFSANSRLSSAKINLIGNSECARTTTSTRFRLRVRALHENKTTPTTELDKTTPTTELDKTSSSSSAEDITKKYGLEAGLWKIFSSGSSTSEEEGKKTSKGKGEEAKELLTKYGGAYLATSITLSLISFSLCYALISAGVDVSALLNKVGITSNETGEKVGTFALAYAAHKAASPIRFPPTVALTPIVASWINKNNNNNNNNNN